MIERRAEWRKFGFKANGEVLCACSYVDNLFSASQTLHGAISILEDFEHQLSVKWALEIKPSSRSCMAAAGSTTSRESDKWPVASTFPLLGHILQNNGSIRPCWRNTRSLMWKSFWANPGSKACRALAEGRRMKLLTKAVAPLLDYRCSRWPPQKTIAKEVDGLQRKMVATLQRVPKYPGEDLGDYVRRRGRLAGTSCRASGLWSKRWFTRAASWNAHLERDRNRYTWSARLLHYMDRQWFADRRASLLPVDGFSGSILAGRTDTRTNPGCVHTRWHDGIEFGKTS